MKFLVCPQCGINRFYVINPAGNKLVVRVTRELDIVPLSPDKELAGYKLDTLYCLGCSWSGSKESLVKYLI